MKAPTRPRRLRSPSTRAWIGVVSHAHVRRGVAGGFAQLCHGRRGPLARMRAGDWLVYYSPMSKMSGGRPVRAFTAIGRVTGTSIEPVELEPGSVFHRRAIVYEAARAVSMAEVSGALHFVRRYANWGVLARRGHFEIDLHDLGVIAAALGVRVTDQRAAGGSCAR
jgi:hypothetical protein